MRIGLKFMVAVFSAVIVCTVKAADPLSNPSVQQAGEGKLRVGQVEVDSKAKTIRFPAAINMRDGMLEYLIVTTKGKVHESLLRTEVEPFQIHTAMLLLGAKPATNAEATAFFDSKQEIPGQKLKIEVEIQTPERKKAVEIEALLMFAESKRAVTTNDVSYWVYNGSRFSHTPGLEPAASGSPARQQDGKPEEEKVFMAQREGSIVSLIADPNALVNNPRRDRENDELWIATPEAIPAVGTPVRVKFTLR